MRSVTSSFRMSLELRKRLEQTARTLKKRKNWVITQAIEEYVQKWHRAALAAEARRQSLLASAKTTEAEEFWEKHADSRGWR
jgi:predicted DNA-binding protein